MILIELLTDENADKPDRRTDRQADGGMDGRTDKAKSIKIVLRTLFYLRIEMAIFQLQTSHINSIF